jgi:hypothetical protein
MQFPYTVFPARPDGAFPNRQSISRPILSVTLQHGDLSIATFAIVDSGADNCLFPASLAAQLGITVPNQNTYVFTGTSEQGQLAYFETVQATIWNGRGEEAPLRFDLYAGFCETLEHVGMGLLGQEGFFSRFRIRFVQVDNFFEVS